MPPPAPREDPPLPEAGPVFYRATSMPLLQEGWRRVWRNRGAPGGDGMSIADFASNAQDRLRLLQFALRNGLYRPGPVRTVRLRKKSGGWRVLRIPSVIDRVAQTAAHLALQEVLEPAFEDGSHGYRPGRSVLTAAAQVEAALAAGFTWVVDADIRAYFDNVPHDNLLNALARHVDEPAFLHLVGLWLALSGTPGRGLPQGAPISPILANLYLDALDEAMAANGFRMVRYADDFVILCRSRARAEEALARLEEALAAMELEVHPQKTAIRAAGEAFDFLGRRFAPRRTRLARQLAELAEAAPETADAADDVEEEDGGDENDADVQADAETSLTGGMLTPPEPAPAAPGTLERMAEGDAPEEPPEMPAPDARGKYAPIIRPMHVAGRGVRVETRQAALAVMDAGGAVLAHVFPQHIDRIDVLPPADISEDALRLAAAHGVPVFLVDGHGRPEAVVEPATPQRARRHLAQAAVALDAARRLDLARRFVHGRIANQRRLLQRLKNRKRDAPDSPRRQALEKAIAALERLRRRALRRPYEGLDHLRGDEAQAARIYWPAFGLCLERGWQSAQFRRRRWPPRDGVNTLLNWLAGMLRRDIETLMLRHGLHVGFGALHAAENGRSAAVFDLMEEFRAPLAEAPALHLLNTGALNASHFARLPGADGETVTWLTAEGVGRVIRAYEDWLDHAVRNPFTGERTSWRGLLEHQVLALARHVEGGDDYAPHVMDF